MYDFFLPVCNVFCLLSVHIVMHGNYSAENNVQHVTIVAEFRKGTFVIF